LVKLYLRELLRCVNELTESITNEPSSTVIETLKIGSLATSLGLAYVYCNHKDQGSQTVSELIASLVQQLSRQRRRVPEDARVLYTMHHSSRTRPVLMEWLQVFRSIITDFSNVYIVIDALDECNEADGTRRTLIEELRRLPGLHILCTSRYLGDIARLLQDATQLELRASDADIARFLDCQITEEKDLMRFCERDPSLRNDMIEKIVKQADGM
jgi:ankyrin repeat domain-containing protein 50